MHLFYKLNRLRKNAAIVDEIVRTVVGPDLVWALLYADGPTEEAICSNYSHDTFVYLQSLYSAEQIERQ